MTAERYAQIMNKEVLSTHELAELYEVSGTTASALMKRIKRHGDRLKLKGKILKDDYIAWKQA